MKKTSGRVTLTKIKDELALRAGTDYVPAAYAKHAAEWILDLQKTVDVMCKHSLKLETKLNKAKKPAAAK